MKKLSAGKAAQNWRRDMKALPKDRDARISALRRWANIRVQAKRERPLAESRRAFQAGFRVAKVTVGQCWACGGWADLVRHHVIQLQHGGANIKINLVSICGECHVAIHPWMDLPNERTQYAAESSPPF